MGLEAEQGKSPDPLINIATLGVRWKQHTKYLDFMVGAKNLWENFVGGDF